MTATSDLPIATQPQEVAQFWLDAGPKQWFNKSAQFDAEFKARFEPAHMAAAARQLDGWLDEPTGALALMILLDQFPRNAYRDTGHMFATDALALHFAEHGAAGVWVRGSHPLTGAAGSDAVRVRVSFVSNATTQREGFGVDDVIVMP